MKAILTCICLLVIMGCDKAKDSQTNDQTAKLAIQIVVGQYLTEDRTRCPRVRLLVTDVREYASNADVKPEQVTDLVRSRIKWDNLSPEQSGLLGGMLLAIEAEMHQEITKESDRVVILKPLEDFMGWLEDTVRLVCPSGGTTAPTSPSSASSSSVDAPSVIIVP